MQKGSKATWTLDPNYVNLIEDYFNNTFLPFTM